MRERERGDDMQVFTHRLPNVPNLELPAARESRYSGCLRGSLFQLRSGKDEL
jgi:hypothetical protein